MSLPVSEVVLVPFMSSESIALPPHIGFNLTSEPVGHPAPGPFHGTGSKDMRVGRRDETREQEDGKNNVKPLSPGDVCAFIAVSSKTFLHPVQDADDE